MWTVTYTCSDWARPCQYSSHSPQHMADALASLAGPYLVTYTETI